MDANRHYLTNKLNPVLEPLIVEVLAAKPNDPVAFMLAWLKKKYAKAKRNNRSF